MPTHKSLLSSNKIVTLTVALLALLVGLFLMSFNNPPSLDDGLRHIAMAKAMLENGLYSSGFAWNNFFYEGYFADHIVDPWYGADLAYIPFASLPIVTALKAFIFSSIVLLMIAFWYVIKPMKLPPAWIAILLSILILGDQLFLSRLMLGRPYVLMTAVTLITLKGILERRYLLTALSLAVAVLVSNLFVFPLFIALLGCIWMWTTSSGLKGACRMGIAIIVGTAVGLLLHPQTIEYAVHTFDVFLRIPIMKDLQVGMELYSGVFTSTSATALLGVIILFSFICFSIKPRVQISEWHKEGITFLCFLVIIFLIAFFVWMRALDFLWPLEIILLAMLIKAEPQKAEVLFTEKHYKETKKNKFQITGKFVALILIALLASNFYLAINSITKGDGHRSLEMFDTLNLIPPDSHVLNLEWDIIPPLIAVRPDLKYATGVVSTYTYLDDPKVHRLLRTASASPVEFDVSLIDGEKWSESILAQYPSDYIVLSTNRFPQFIYNLRGVESLRELSESGAVIAVFKIVE
ncbi:hypothetical protein KJ652_01360 [Patescibacteria group bacterium]|nr:hypothetical protein [Patescibacteria group bacterium]